MQATVSVSDSQSVVRLQGRFDFNAHRDFRTAVDTALAGAAKQVVVDLSGVDYLDSSALGMLLMLRDRTKSAGREVSLSGARGPVKQVLDIANFGKLFKID